MDVNFFCLFSFSPVVSNLSLHKAVFSRSAVVPSASWALGERWRSGEFFTSVGRVTDMDIAGAGAAWSSWKNLKALLNSVP